MNDELNTIYLSLNIFLYLMLSFIYKKKKKKMDVGGYLILLYFLMSIMSFYVFFNPTSFNTFKDLTLFPFIYLFLMLFVSMYPVLKFEQRNKSIQKPSIHMLNILSVFIIIFAVLQLITVIPNFIQGMSLILTDSDVGLELYSETVSNNDLVGKGIENIPAIISQAFSYLTIFLLFYYLTLQNLRWGKVMIFFLLLSTLLHIMASISMGLRGGVVTILSLMLYSFLLFREHIQANRRKKIVKGLIVIGIMVSIPFMAITASRFGSGASGSTDDGSISSMMSYGGQSFLNFNNYGLDAGGIRYGDRTVNLFKSFFYDDVPRNYVERRFKYPNLLMDDNIFYTFVGDFAIDFGAFGGAMILIVLSIVFRNSTKVQGNLIPFHKLIILYFVICTCVTGFSLYRFSDIGGNLKIIVFILVYYIFKLDFISQRRKFYLS